MKKPTFYEQVGIIIPQTRWDFIDLEALLPSDHRARVVMSFVESLDLSALYDAIKAREGEPGRPPPDPAVVLALWLYDPPLVIRAFGAHCQ